MDKNVQKDFLIRKATGMNATIDLKGCTHDFISSAAHIQNFVIQLCKLMDFERHSDAQVVAFGSGTKAGFTLFQLLNMAAITAHFFSDTGTACIDIFSYKPFSPLEAAEFSEKFFEATKCEIRHQFRI